MKEEGGRRKADRDAQVNRDPRDRRRGMTLFELILVLVLLVVVGSLAAPLFEGSFASIRLRRGTDQVLATWSQARSQAIEAGQIYQFRFQPESGNYRVDLWLGGLEPDSLEPGPLEHNLPDGRQGITTTEATVEELRLANWKLAESLPEEIVFSAAESVSEDELGQRNLTRLDQDSLTEWSAPILFYPDGTTSSASLLLNNGKTLYRRATLRDLTGVARASDLLTQEDVDRLKSQ